jgi:hypothetical protein
VRGAPGGDEIGTEDALLPDRELVLGRLAIDEEATPRLEGVRGGSALGRVRAALSR